MTTRRAVDIRLGLLGVALPRKSSVLRWQGDRVVHPLGTSGANASPLHYISVVARQGEIVVLEQQVMLWRRGKAPPAIADPLAGRQAVVHTTRVVEPPAKSPDQLPNFMANSNSKVRPGDAPRATPSTCTWRLN